MYTLALKTPVNTSKTKITVYINKYDCRNSCCDSL